MPPTIKVPVELGPRRYDVQLGSGILHQSGDLVRSAGLAHLNAFVLTNSQVGSHYFEPLRASLASAGFRKVVRHDVPVSEKAKSWDEFTGTCAALLQSFPEAGASPLVFLLGGGVVGDLGGFAAAVFRRGVPFVQVPTTLLSAVDSSVGGKVAVNFGGVKNIIGAFSQPRLVICDLATLGTLDAREIRSGSAEVIKYGAVCSAKLFEQLERGDLEKLLQLEPGTLLDVVGQCVALKARVVEQDELDTKGIRNVLNFGHTIGHALELSADYELTHGEAISVGMVAATRLAVHLGMVDSQFLSRLEALLLRAQLPIHYSGHPELFDRVKKALQLDKKFREGRNVFVLPCGVGRWEQRENVDWAIVDSAVEAALA